MTLHLFLGSLIHPIAISEVIIVDDNHRMSCMSRATLNFRERQCRWGGLSRQISDSSVNVPKRKWLVSPPTTSDAELNQNRICPQGIREKVVSDSALSLPSRNISPKSTSSPEGTGNQRWNDPHQIMDVKSTSIKRSGRPTSEIIIDAMGLCLGDESSSCSDSIRSGERNPQNNQGISRSLYQLNHFGTQTPSSIQLSRALQDCFTPLPPVTLYKGTTGSELLETPSNTKREHGMPTAGPSDQEGQCITFAAKAS